MWSLWDYLLATESFVDITGSAINFFERVLGFFRRWITVCNLDYSSYFVVSRPHRHSQEKRQTDFERSQRWGGVSCNVEVTTARTWRQGPPERGNRQDRKESCENGDERLHDWIFSWRIVNRRKVGMLDRLWWWNSTRENIDSLYVHQLLLIPWSPPRQVFSTAVLVSMTFSDLQRALTRSSARADHAKSLDLRTRDSKWSAGAMRSWGHMPL